MSGGGVSEVYVVTVKRVPTMAIEEAIIGNVNHLSNSAYLGYSCEGGVVYFVGIA